MTRRITKELRHSAPLEAVTAMLLDPAFRERVCVEQEVDSHSVEAGPFAGDNGRDAGERMLITQVQQVRNVPSLVRKFVGDTITIRQEEIWRGSKAEVTLTIPDQPGRITGTTRLDGDGDETRQLIDWTVTVNVAMVGKKVEAIIADLLESALAVEQEVAQAWLAE